MGKTSAKISMPKKVDLVLHLSSAELKKRYQKSSTPLESRRWHLLWKIAQGWSIKNSAYSVGISYGYAQRIVKTYNQQGEQGVKLKKRSRHTGGKKALLTHNQIQKLIQALKEKPSDGGVWTGVKVARWIEKETHREKVSNQRGWDYLKKCRYSWQRPRPTHKKGNKLEQAQFQQNLPLLVETFATEVGANQKKIILLIEDRAGWHRSEKVKIPPGIEVEFLPPYSPELQPAERLWSLLDEPLVNQHFETIEQIEDVLAQRCFVLEDMKDEIRNLTNYHWLTYA